MTKVSNFVRFASMLRIRLQRVGRRHEPSFRIVLTESKNSTKSGRIKEILGSYDPRFDNPQIKADRVRYWIGVGARPTDTMHNILVSKKVIAGKKINVLPKKKPLAKAEEVKSNESVAETKIPETVNESEVAETKEA